MTRSIFIILLLILILSAGVFLLADAILRILPSESLPVHWGYKIEEKKIHCWHWETKTIRLCPDVQAELLHPLGYRFRIATNDRGERITLIQNGLYKNSEIWVIGDSLSMGYGVNDEESFPYLLSQMGFSVRNLASDSLGAADIFRILEYELQNLETKENFSYPLAVFWIFSRSDFLDDRKKKSYFKFILGKISPVFNILRAELERAQLARDANDYKEYWREEYHPPEPDHPTLVSIRALQEICQEKGIRAIVLLVPDWNPILDRAVLETEYFQFIRNFFQDSRYELIDFTEAYRRRSGEILWIPNDGHPNASAHRLFAEFSAKNMRKVLDQK